VTVFVSIAGLLAIGALAFVVLPLLRRSSGVSLSRNAINVAVYRDQLRELEADLRAGTLGQDQYDRSRAEIEARLLQDVNRPDSTPAQRRSEGSAVAFAIAVPACALVVYLAVGTPQAILTATAPPGSPHGVTEEQVVAMVERLAARMRANPDDPQGWKILARSYAALGRFKEASDAYANAAARATDDAQLYADYADALAMAQGRTLEGEPEKLIARALAIDPTNTKALALAGTIAFNRKDYAKAADYWERILAVEPADSETAQAARANVAEARALAGGAPAAPPAAASAPSAPAAPGSRVSGTVRLAPELAAKVAPTDTVFVFARAAEGPRMPLAILRRQARELPISFALDDSMAMTPAMKLSSFSRVVIGARVSKSANATPQAGDLQGVTAPVDVGAERIDVVIDTELR
jgi:cytochrome c-type biogenesis protein CcmH